MPEMTTEAAIIELNRLKSQERMDIDRERLTAAIDKLTEAGRKQIPRKPEIGELLITKRLGNLCSRCKAVAVKNDNFCYNCGQALDWSDEDNAN